MSLSPSEETFLSQVRVRKAAAPSHPAKLPFLKRFRILRPLGYSLLVFGVLGGILFLTTMENIAGQFGGGGIADALTVLQEIPAEDLNLGDFGLAWLPTYVQLYELRWLVAFGIVALFGVAALVVFAIDASRRNKA